MPQRLGGPPPKTALQENLPIPKDPIEFLGHAVSIG